jgi:hypothetical protein
VDQLARHQEQEISGVARLRDKYAADKERLDALTASVAERDADLAAQKTRSRRRSTRCRSCGSRRTASGAERRRRYGSARAR